MMYYLLSSRCGLWSAAMEHDVFPEWKDEIKDKSEDLAHVCGLANLSKNEGAVVASPGGRIMWELYSSGMWSRENASV